MRDTNPLTTSVLCLSVAGSLLAASKAEAQVCNVLVRDSFRLGERPHGGNGNPRVAEMEDHLSGFWPLTTVAGAQWISASAGSPFSWQFGMASPDESEIDPLDDINGIAWAEGGAVMLLPFTMPAQPVTVSVNVVVFGNIAGTAAARVGFTSSTTLTDNFATSGVLWLELTQLDHWTIYANGSQVVASGSLPGAFGAGVLESGFYNLQLRFDPVASTVSAHVENLEIASTPVSLAATASHFAMEAHDGIIAANNLAVFTGPRISANAPATTSACEGASVTMTATVTDAAHGVVRWHKESPDGPLILFDGPQLDGSVLAGVHTASLSVSNITLAAGGTYRLFVTGMCGMGFGDPAELAVFCAAGCDSIDFNSNGVFPEDQDVADFFNVLAGADCPACNDIDFNNNGVFPEDQDVVDFFNVLAGGSCP